MFLVDENETYVINLAKYTIQKETVREQLNLKDFISYRIIATKGKEWLCLYSDNDKKYVDDEFKELISAIRQEKKYFKFGELQKFD